MAQETRLDNKLHDILRQANKSSHINEEALAGTIATRKLASFSYKHEDQTKYASKNAIIKYVQFAHDIDIINDAMRPSEQTVNLRNENAVLNHLYQRVMQFANNSRVNNDNSIDVILRQKVELLLNDHRLPTKDNIYALLKDETLMKKWQFEYFLQLVNIAHPEVLAISRKWLYLPAGTLQVESK